MDRNAISFAILRATLGVLFLFAGVGKFIDGRAEFAADLVGRFEETWLPDGLVSFSGQVLPFLEVGLGLLLILGLFTLPALIATGLLVLVLLFGTTVVEDHEATGRNGLYALVTFVLLWLSPHDRLALGSVTPRDPR